MDATTTGVGCDYCCMLYEKLGCIFRAFNDIVPQMNVRLGYNTEHQGVHVHNRPAKLLSLINDVLQVQLKARWTGHYLDAMKGVMSNSRGKETYVVIFRRSFAECSNRWEEARERQ